MIAGGHCHPVPHPVLCLGVPALAHGIPTAPTPLHHWGCWWLLSYHSPCGPLRYATAFLLYGPIGLCLPLPCFLMGLALRPAPCDGVLVLAECRRRPYMW